MSSLASTFNSSATLFTMDIYKKRRPNASEKQLVRVGRIATAVLCVSGLAWIPLMKYISSELYHYLQSVQSYLAPPIAAVFLLGVFWKRINGKAAVTTLVGGFVVGMARIALELNKTHLTGALKAFASINFLYFCIIMFVICVAALIIISLLTARPDYAKLNGLTYATTVAEDRATSRASWGWKEVVLSLVVVAVVAFSLIYFSGPK
jgi:SSS family solute:Na+ symporter